MTPDLQRLREDLEMVVVYDDQTPYGSGVSGLSDVLLRKTCASLAAIAHRDGIDALMAQAERWMPEIMGPQALGALYEGPRTLREACLYPDPTKVMPAAFELTIPHAGTMQSTTVPIDPALRGELARWIAQWQRGAMRPRNPSAAALWDRLQALGAFERSRVVHQPLRDGLTFIGHATVATQAEGTQLLFDPFLLPPSPEDPPHLRPHTAVDLRPSAIFVTHSHPDHFDVGTLMRLGADIPIFVPAVSRESLLSTDMVLRLRELGFTNVRPMAWHEEVRFGPFRVIALPFYGEQPTDGDVLHPEAPNVGNTYVVEGHGQRIAMVADAGRDGRGDVLEVAAQARRSIGPVDLLLGGYRAWRVQPIRYLFSSVARYLLLVPPQLRTQWMKIMNDADDLVRTGIAWGADAVVPYANGGAPWFARIGLGPHGTAERPDDPNIDPPLRCVEQALESAASDLRLLALQTGARHPMFSPAGPHTDAAA